VRILGWYTDSDGTVSSKFATSAALRKTTGNGNRLALAISKTARIFGAFIHFSFSIQDLMEPRDPDPIGMPVVLLVV